MSPSRETVLLLGSRRAGSRRATARRAGPLGARGAPAVGMALAIGLAMTACSGSDAESAAAATAPAEATQAAPDASDDERSARPGVTGEVAAVDGDIAQVQGTDGQTAVTWTADTVVTQDGGGSLADVAVGSCVSAVAATDGTSDDDAADESGALVATAVTISAPGADGTCEAGSIGAGAGGLPTDLPDDLPTDLPDDLPSDFPEGFPEDFPSDLPTGVDPSGRAGGTWGGSAVLGTVTAVSDTGFTVEQTSWSGEAESETTTVQIEITDDTAYTASHVADASAIAVGQCMTAQGTQDDTGMLTAEVIALSQPGDDGCSTGLGFGGGGPGGFGGFGGEGSDGTTEDGSDA